MPSELAKLFGEDRRRILATAGADPFILDLLSVLRRAGPPYRLTTRELTERTRVTEGAISQRIARAENAGLVQRAGAGDGSRSVIVSLTAAGHAMVESRVDQVLRTRSRRRSWPRWPISTGRRWNAGSTTRASR